MEAWYLVHSKPRLERTAFENLTRQGYRAYLPLVTGRRRRLRGHARSIEPMFPRYLFVRLDDETENWSPIRSTIGVANLVRFGLHAARVPDSLIALIQTREADGVHHLPEPDFRPGDRVRLVEGVMAGYEGVLQARTGRERVVMLLQIAQHSVARIRVGADDIELVS